MVAEPVVEFTPEVHFAQRLACNDKVQRDRAVKKLRKYIAARSCSGKGFSKDELLKLWMGLFYCMWMCDKPLVQEDLARIIAQLMLGFARPESALAFAEAFFRTMRREWYNIDVFRLDKFQMLVRRFVNQIFVLLKNNKWNKQLVATALKMFSSGPLSAAEEASVDGIRFHIADIFLEELTMVSAAELTARQNLAFLEPFASLLAATRGASVTNRVCKRVFHSIIYDSPLAQKLHPDDEGDSDDDDDDAGERTVAPPRLSFDYSAIAELLFRTASERKCAARNRGALYRLVRRFRDLEAGIFPLEPDLDSGSELELKASDYDEAVERLGAEMERDHEERQRFKKMKRRDAEPPDSNEVSGEEEVSSAAEESEEEEASPAAEEKMKKKKKEKKKKKKKKKAPSEEGEATEEVGKKRKSNGSSAGAASEKTKKKKKKQRLAEARQSSVAAGDESLETTKNASMVNSGKSPSPGRKRKRTESRETLNSGVSVRDVRPNGAVGAKKKKKRQVASSSPPSSDCANSVDASQDEVSTPLPPRGGATRAAPGAGTTGGESSASDVPVGTTTAKTKKKKKKKVKSSHVTSDGPGGESVAREPSRSWAEPPKEGEVEIFIPRKKTKAATAAKNPQPALPSLPAFTRVTTPPPAFVRRGAHKVAPGTAPRIAAATTPVRLCASEPSRKKVQFALMRNTQHAHWDYKSSVKSSPAVPFDKDRRPVQGLLKFSPGGEESPATGKSGKKAMKGRRLRAADFF
ncbi:PREDICTED: ribosomal RNA processing protein 1 homolog A-like [Priapulus caudatus]|uniref:Ribosomal RNA processing protein 1 homolog A-like n=1 Tax=Priapulus caudatus TaxID=37621 RepID=A0ABM1DTQ3_PRICU|nr:PREDICTED: ribosomal RNA processing protein 1 homolog A-like [Priapulus caudatus]